MSIDASAKKSTNNYGLTIGISVGLMFGLMLNNTTSGMLLGLSLGMFWDRLSKAKWRLKYKKLNTILEFCEAALPWVCIGIAILMFSVQ